MKRAMIILLVCLLLGCCISSGFAASYTLPEKLANRAEGYIYRYGGRGTGRRSFSEGGHGRGVFAAGNGFGARSALLYFPG